MSKLTQNQIINQLKVAGIAREIGREAGEIPAPDQADPSYIQEDIFDRSTTSLGAIEKALERFNGWSVRSIDAHIYDLSMSLIEVPPSFVPMEDFDILVPGQSYDLPVYDVEPEVGLVARQGEGLVINFVRGAIDNDRPKAAGTLHEHIIAMQIHDLSAKNEEVPHEETTEAIRCLKNALNHLRARKIDRLTRGVMGTDNK